MIASFQFLPVQPHDVDLGDKTYSLVPWDDPPNKELLESIKQFGVLHPPILHQKNNNSYRVIAGRKRIATVLLLEPERPLHCIVVPSDMKQLDAFALLLEESTKGRQPSIVEQSIFFTKLLQVSSDEEILPFLRQLGYKPQKHILRELLKLQSLSEPVLESLHRDTIQLKNAQKLLHLPDTDQTLIVKLINNFRLGGSKQRNLIQMCTDLIMRRNIPLEQILLNLPGSNELERPNNVPQQAAALLAWLRTQCYPQASQAEKRFNSRVSTLNLPSTMQIKHDPSFELDEVTLSLRFPDLDSLEKVINDIKNIIQEEIN